MYIYYFYLYRLEWDECGKELVLLLPMDLVPSGTNSKAKLIKLSCHTRKPILCPWLAFEQGNQMVN